MAGGDGVVFIAAKDQIDSIKDDNVVFATLTKNQVAEIEFKDANVDVAAVTDANPIIAAACEHEIDSDHFVDFGFAAGNQVVAIQSEVQIAELDA